jgi:pyruvate formate lyase activating enzyme
MEEKSFWKIPVAEIQAINAIDLPGRLACVLFTKGCPWKCRDCQYHNLQFIGNCIPWKEIDTLLPELRGFLKGVVISGCEPTLHPELWNLLSWIRGLGFAVAIHTSGFNPFMLSRILTKKMVDFVTMDIKAPPDAYDRITQTENACLKVSRSISIILDSGVDYEFRTTWNPSVLTENELMETMRKASKSGIKKFCLQKFNNHNVSNCEPVAQSAYQAFPPSIVGEARMLFPVFDVR